VTTWCITETFGSIPKIDSGNVAEPVLGTEGEVVFAAAFFATAFFAAGFAAVFFATFFAAFFTGFADAIALLSLHRVAHNHDAAIWARNRALNQQQATLEIGLDYFKIQSGCLLMTHVAGHAQTFEYTTWK
jgi:hypothetical protein